LEDLADPDEAMTIAERVRATLDAPVRFDDHEVDLTASIGIALAPNPAERADEILSRADKAMYRAKENGRDRIRLERADETLDLTSEGNDDDARSPERITPE
jgi:diguanylate cyclase (GGDEF)-like protein